MQQGYVGFCSGSGSADAEKFRVLPCKTHVSVGSCPYRDRCVYLHDPRIAARATKTSTRRKNREDTGTDLFFWPTMCKPTTSIRQDHHRKTQVVQAYSVDSGGVGSILVHSMWEHFVDNCKGSSLLNSSQERSVHTGKKRLVVFRNLSQGKIIVEEFSKSKRPVKADYFVPVSTAGEKFSPPATPRTPPSSPYGFRKYTTGNSPISVIIGESNRRRLAYTGED